MAEEDRFGPKELTTSNSKTTSCDDNGSDVDLEKLEKGNFLDQVNNLVLGF